MFSPLQIEQLKGNIMPIVIVYRAQVIHSLEGVAAIPVITEKHNIISAYDKWLVEQHRGCNLWKVLLGKKM